MADSLLSFVNPDDSCNVMVMDIHTGLTSRHSGHTGSVNRTVACTSASSGKQLILSGSFDQTVRLWDMSADADDSSLRLTLRGQDEDPGKGVVWGLCFCGERAAASGSYGKISIHDLVTGACSLSLAAGETWLTWLCASSDGHLLMSAHGEDEPAVVRLWDLRCGGSVRALRLTGHEGCIWAVDMDAAGRCGISASGDRTLRMWDLGSCRCSAVLEGHDHIVTSVRMDRQGTAAVSSSGYAEHAMRVWDLSRNKLVGAYRPSRLVYTVASPDLSTVAAIGNWGQPSQYCIHVWKN
jgi:WD40 repeat protein